MDHSMLKNLGMNKTETQAYLKLLESEVIGANALSKKIGENRTTTYNILDRMIKKGLVSFYLRNNIKYYTAVSPKDLVDRYIKTGQTLKAILPELLALDNKHGKKPKISFYEDVEGIIQICETLLVPNSTRESFMGIEEELIHPEIKKYFEDYFVNQRINIKQKYRGIVTGYIPMGRDHPQSESGQHRELKYVDPKKLPIKIHVDIYPPNKVAIYSYNKDEMMGVIIEHESFYITMKTIFKLAWAGVDVLT